VTVLGVKICVFGIAVSFGVIVGDTGDLGNRHGNEDVRLLMAFDCNCQREEDEDEHCDTMH